VRREIALVQAGRLAALGEQPAKRLASHSDLAGIDHGSPPRVTLCQTSVTDNWLACPTWQLGLAAAMTPQPTTSAVALATGCADRSTDLDRLHELATTVLNKHINDNGFPAGGGPRDCEPVRPPAAVGRPHFRTRVESERWVLFQATADSMHDNTAWRKSIDPPRTSQVLGHCTVPAPRSRWDEIKDALVTMDYLRRL